MKKTKLIMPIIGIGATCASFAPLATLTSCNSNKFSVEMTRGSKEKTIYANTKIAYFYFKQNQLDNYTKTKAKIVNLKIAGAEASVVSGLTKTAVDAGGGIRVTIDIETLYNHYSNPTSIEFDLQFTNKANNTSYTIEGFKLNANQETEVSYPFEIEDKKIMKFNSDFFTSEDYATAWKNIFVPIDLPELGNAKISLPIQEFDDDGNIVVVEDVTTTYYKMVIPKDFTEIEKLAFYDQDNLISTIPDAVKSLEFEKGSVYSMIGEEAFKASPLIFASLPSFSKDDGLGVGCFKDSTNLVSCQFSETVDTESGVMVIFPDTFANTHIPYFKVPNYVVELLSGDGHPVFSNTASIPFILDLTELGSTEQITHYASLIKTNTVSTTQQIFIYAANEASNAAIQDIIKELAIKGITCGIPFAFDTHDSDVYIDIAMEAILKESLSLVSSSLGNLYSPFKFQLPNLYTEADGTQHYINTIQKYLIDFICNLNNEGCFSSLVLPQNLNVIPEGLFVSAQSSADNHSILWQVNIPSNAALEERSFAYNHSLCSFTFDGTGDEWTKLITNKAADLWITGSPKITVRCSNGDVKYVSQTEIVIE